ncbi:MAG TPA: TylF/MycF/NovP-related O-methyltransferase, partial [Myxococcaceae bacterium]|nr:TylF/MycF/NovP-related O-methyltransferase [Myxococcaceae bacterium]
MDTGPDDPYSTFLSKIWRELQMLPVKLAESVEPFWPTEFGELSHYVRSYTMLSHARLRGLYRAVRHVTEQRIPGDIVECGTSEGGSALLMAMTLKRYGVGRHLWAFDTFLGMPPPSEKDPAEAWDYVGTLGHDLDHVRSIFHRWGIREGFTLVPGLFQETLPRARIERI